MTNYEASKIAYRIAVARLANGRWVVFYADMDGKSVGGQSFDAASIDDALRALENDRDAVHPAWQHDAGYNPEFRGAAPARAGEDY